MNVELAGGGYHVVVDPTAGGAILSADWRDTPILAPWDEGLPPFKAGCFAMLPFANRIADGRFTFAGRNHALPVNLPAENMAVHGFARDHPWTLAAHTPHDAALEQDFAQDSNPYRYHARQEIAVSGQGIRVALSVRNDGDAPMPFGIGLHPWFAKTKGITLGFASRGAYGRDARGLPVAPPRAVATFEADGPGALDGHDWFDGCFADWSPRLARIVRPQDGLEIDIVADGAFRHLHVFAPDDREILCAEPVSHVPDAVNRPALGAMDVLAPGAVLSGAMTLRAAPYPPE